MRSIPVDTGRMVFMAAGSPRPKLVNRQTGEIKKNNDGVQLWQVQVLAVQEGRDGDTALITFPSPHMPTIQMGTPLRVSGLVAIPWEAGERHGVAFSAAEVEPATAGRE